MRTNNRLALLILLLLPVLFFSCGPVPSGGGGGGSSSGPLARLLPQDMQYDALIHSVQLFADDGTPNSQMLPAVTPLNSQGQLVLRFDDLRPEREDYAVRIVHCDYNWEISRLSTLEYLYDYNEFPLNDFSFSYNTQRQYVHYEFALPRVKLSGNYLLVVYRNRNPNDVVLSRRFMVYENQTPLQANLVAAPGGERLRRQQIDLSVLYRNLPGIIDPTTQVKVVIRQNQRWDNAVINLRPTGDRTASQSLEYQLFDLSNAFLGGNEYRWFDLRTVRALGQNVGRIRLDTVRKTMDAFLQPDKSRGRLAYAQRQDINGQYVVVNLDFPEDPTISSEYADVHFFLKTDGPLAWPVYVAGAFSNYQKGAPYQMQYDASLGGYRTDVLLKQGWYNYLYLADNKENALALEGSFSETENLYEIFVYYRPNTRPTDLLVGYSQLSTSTRR